MEYGIISLMVIGGILFYIKINELQKQVKAQQVQLDKLCKETGNQQLATYFISDEEKEYIAHLKNSGKEVDAVKKVREITSMDLVQAKQYGFRLNHVNCCLHSTLFDIVPHKKPPKTLFLQCIRRL